MKYTYKKPITEIDVLVFEAFPLCASRLQVGDTFTPDDGGKFIQTQVLSTSEAIADGVDPYSWGQGYGTNRTNETGLWED